MAIAGKVAITLSNENDGKWSASVTYDRLTAVTHNNNLYISKKPSTNAEPTVADEFWFLALEGFSGEELEEIIDGTTQVGNAKTLDGHGAEYFAKGTDLANYLNKNTGGTVKSPVKVSNDVKPHILSFESGDSGNAGVYDDTKNEWLIKSPLDGTTAFNGTASGNLPLTGGKISGNIDFENSGSTTTVSVFNYDNTAYIRNKTDNNNFVDLQIPKNGDAYFYKNVNGSGSVNQILHTGNVGDYAIRNDLNGRISVKYPAPLTLNNTNESSAGVRLDMQLRGNILGSLGFEGEVPSYFPAHESGSKELLHTGNKPSGSYNGNGSATKRTIQIGGTGNVLCIQSGYYLTFAYSEGAVTFAVDTGTTNHFTKEQVNFTDGVLTLATDSGFVNLSGYEYDWNVL